MQLTINTGTALHAVRRWLWQLRSPTRRLEMLRTRGRCLDCGSTLTPNERHYYGSNCERCEGIAQQALHEELQRANARHVANYLDMVRGKADAAIAKSGSQCGGGVTEVDPRFAAAHYQDGRDLHAHGAPGMRPVKLPPYPATPAEREALAKAGAAYGARAVEPAARDEMEQGDASWCIDPDMGDR